MCKAGPADVVARRFPLVEAKAHRRRGTHLDGGDAAFRVALGKMPIACGVEGSFDIDWDQQARAFSQLFGVDIATVLTRRQRAQTLAGNRSA